MRFLTPLTVLGLLPLLAACSSSSSSNKGGTSSLRIEHVIVITMENHDATSIIGNTTDAPYINGTLVPSYASASNFIDTLPIIIPSEPHYVIMEAGTNVFADVTFGGDAPPDATNSTSSTAHLSTQLDTAGKSWISYQEGIDATTGTCPINASGFYLPKHDPFVFFQDVSGNPPAADNARCASHHRTFDALWADLANAKMPDYAFVTPDQCHDMHGQAGCPNSNIVQSGDDWLSANMKKFTDYADANDAAIFIIWDEGETTTTVPFLAIGPHAKKNYVSSVKVTHASLVKTVEKVFGLPTLDTVTSENDFSDFFEAGAFP